MDMYDPASPGEVLAGWLEDLDMSAIMDDIVYQCGEACIEALANFLPDAQILVISALSDKATALRAIRKGAHGFLHKPFTDTELLDSLLELIG